MSKIAKLPVLLLVAVLLQACGEMFVDEQALMDRVAGYLADDRKNAAAIELRNVLKQNPENGEARFLLASIHLDYGDYVTAEKEYRQARASGWDAAQATVGIVRALHGGGKYARVVELEVDDEGWSPSVRASLLALRAISAAHLGEHAVATATLARAEALDADSADVARAAVQLAYLDGRPGAAENRLAAALQRFPDNTGLQMLRANVLVREDPVAAQAIYERVIAQDRHGFVSADGRMARLRLVQLNILDGKLDSAAQYLDELSRYNSRDPYVNYLKGVLAFQRRNYDDASESFLRVLKLAPDHNPTRLLFGVVSYALKNYEQAAYFLDKYLAAVPDNLVARKLLARSYLILNRSEEAGKILRPEVTEQQNDAELLALAGISELNRGDAAAGIAGLQSALRIDPDSITLRSELARAYIDAGETDQAISELQGMLAGDDRQQQTEALLILAHLRAGENANAINRVLDMVARYPDEAAVHALAGNTLAATGDLDEARRYFGRALELQPGFPPARLSLAHVEEQAGNLAAAAAGYRALVEEDANAIQPLIALARVAGREGDAVAVVRWLDEAIKRAPRDIRPRIYLAEHHLQAGDLEAARRQADAAQEIATRVPQLLLLSGRIHMTAGRYRKALVPLHSLVEQVPDAVSAKLLIGESYLQLGELASARRELRKVFEYAPDNVPARALLTKVEIHAGEFEQALAYSRAIQQLEPGLFLGHELAGDSLMSSGQYAAAMQAYAAAWERLPSSGLVLKRAENLLRADDAAAARGLLLAWLDEQPGDVAVLAQLGTYEQAAGRLQAAAGHYEQAIALDENNVVALNNLSGLYLADGRLDEALELAERALVIDRDNPGIQDTLGWALVRNGQYGRALTMLDAAIKQLPDVPEVRFHHAVASYHAGNRDAARRRLRELLSTTPQFEGRAEAESLLREWAG